MIGDARVPIKEASDYPWSGDIRITLDPDAAAEFDVKLRIPGWAKEATLAVNGERVALDPLNGYATVRRRWSKGDVIALDLPMPAERIYAHPNVRMDVGRVALRRGPQIYCVEEADNPGGPVQALTLPRDADIQSKWRDDLFGGVMTLTGQAKRLSPGDGERRLYSTDPPVARDVSMTALPYYLWANRAPGSMQVWIAEAID